MRGLENLDFFTDKSLVDDPYDYYDAIRRCPVWREPAHGVVMVSGYDDAVAVQRDADQTFSVGNIVSGPWSGIPSETDCDDMSAGSPSIGMLRGLRIPALTRENAVSTAVSFRLVPVQSRSLPTVSFSGLDAVKRGHRLPDPERAARVSIKSA